jgi:D-alanyl-D-alanine carboxypeptidase
LEQNKELSQFDIPLAKRTHLNDSNSIFKKKLLILSPFLFLLFSIFALRLIRNVEIGTLDNLNFQAQINHDHRILGHLPYAEIPEEKLVLIEPNIQVHIDMRDSLLKMRDEAKKDGIYLVFLSGYRSINLQNDIFYSLKSIRNQVAAERARVSAPPGYSEHSTGFAIDIGDATQRETNFETEFENTDAFRWLKNNAAKFHFKLSFDKNNKFIDYEPWHWRYEGSIEALKVFETSNKKLKSKLSN